MVNKLTVSPEGVVQDDNDRRFYSAPLGTSDPAALGYNSPDPTDPHFLIRMTPGPTNLAKGIAMDFTIHVKSLVDFDSNHPLTLTLGPIIGSGSGNFSEPGLSTDPLDPTVTLKDGAILITAKSTGNAARVILRTDYPPDWWAGSSKCVVQAVESPTTTGAPAQVMTCVEANVFVADRVPAMWHRWADTRKGPGQSDDH